MTPRALFLPLALLALAACSGPGYHRIDEALNDECPRSGKRISADALTIYRGRIVGFCKPECRDDFAAHVGERPEDRAFFDRLIAATYVEAYSEAHVEPATAR